MVGGSAFADAETGKVDPAKCPPAPRDWETYVGSRGPDFIPLILFLRNGSLYCLLENEFAYRWKPINRVSFPLPPACTTKSTSFSRPPRTAQSKLSSSPICPWDSRR